MSYKMAVTYEDNHILVKVSGKDDYETSREILSKIVDACKAHDCLNILGVADMSPLSVLDSFKHPEIFKELGITLKHRIAWVDKNEKTRESLRFCVMVLRNRGMITGDIFEDVEKARDWLLSGQPASAV